MLNPFTYLILQVKNIEAKFLFYSIVFVLCNKFITFAVMRYIIRSSEFDEFYQNLPVSAQQKILYALSVITEIRMVSTKLVKKLVGTDFYELRISVDNEYRVILFAIDHSNFIEAEQILLLNGFMKKSTKEYKKEIAKAQRILDNL